MSRFDRSRLGIDERGRIWDVAHALDLLRTNYRNAVRATSNGLAPHEARMRAWRCLSDFVDGRRAEVERIHARQESAS